MKNNVAEWLRQLADNPTADGFCPIFPGTLREAADEIDRLCGIVDRLQGECGQTRGKVVLDSLRRGRT